MSLLQYLFLWLAIASAVTFLVFLWDKSAAKREARRIPERTLIAWSVLGGSPGALLAMVVLRHKIRKPAFWVVEVVTTLLWGWGLWSLSGPVA